MEKARQDSQEGARKRNRWARWLVLGLVSINLFIWASVYFLSAAWAVSNAVHLLDLASNKQRFITDGNSLELVPVGKYRGYLIVSQHRYHKNGGSYDDFWLVSPKGKTIASLGENRRLFGQKLTNLKLRTTVKSGLTLCSEKC